MFRLPLVVAFLLFAGPGLVRAQEPSAPAQEPQKQTTATPPPAEEKLNHLFQFGLGVRAGTGYRVIVPYGEEFCGDRTESGDPKSVCGGRQPFWMEFSPSFGITSGLELLVDVRLYFEEDFAKSKAWFISPGLKYYTDPDSLFKFFLTGQVVLENQDLEGTGLKNFDVGIRSALGLQFDVLRYVGLYAQGGIILGFNRWLTFVVDFGGGIQVRY